MVSKVCLDCGSVIPRGPRCAACASVLNIERGSSTRRGYGARHRALAARYLRIHSACELHLAGCTRRAVDADHRVPVRAGGRAVWSNYQAACRACHATKTRRDAEEYPTHA